MNQLDTQVGGNHYKVMGIQPWQYFRANMTAEQFTAYMIGNIHKYIWREKDCRITDLKKARHYIDGLIEYLEEK